MRVWSVWLSAWAQPNDCWLRPDLCTLPPRKQLCRRAGIAGAVSHRRRYNGRVADVQALVSAALRVALCSPAVDAHWQRAEHAHELRRHCPPFCSAAGTYASVGGYSHCSPCTADYYQPRTGSIECLPCPGGSYAHFPGSSVCVACFYGQAVVMADASGTYINRTPEQPSAGGLGRRSVTGAGALPHAREAILACRVPDTQTSALPCPPAPPLQVSSQP